MMFAFNNLGNICNFRIASCHSKYAMQSNGPKVQPKNTSDTSQPKKSLFMTSKPQV